MPSESDLVGRTVVELSALLQSGEVSARQLAVAFMEQIDVVNPTVNAVISVCPDATLRQADAADRKIASGQAGPLTGIPLLHKDIFCTRGLRTTCGSKMLADFIPPYDAAVVQRLSEAGMVMLGKCNMDEFAMGSSNETSYFGPCRNPWDIKRVPGGSSGGSAAAVACRMAPVATGTDTGGSIRQPAAMCGVTGIKPTYGRVSRYGMVAFASSMDQAGPIARTAKDCALVLQAISGMDPADSTSADQPVPDFTAGLGKGVKGLRIGLPYEYFGKALNPEVASRVRSALAVLEQAGAELVNVSLPNTHHAIATYYVIAPAEASANLSRYDGVRYGYRCDDPQDLADLYVRSRSEGFGPEVQRRILVGTYALSAGFYDAYFKKAQQVRRIISDDFHRAFERVDVIAGPATPGVAFPLGAKNTDPLALYMEDTYTLGVNLAGLPGITLPAGTVNELPVGLQLIGRPFDEGTLFCAGDQLQRESDWHRQTPTLSEIAS